MSAVATPGTRNYAAGFGPAILQAGDRYRFKVFCSSATWQLLTARGIPANAEWERTSFPHTALRVAWEQTALPVKLQRWNADVCFSPFDTAPLAARCPVLLAIRNPMPTFSMTGRAKRPGVLSRSRVQFYVAKAACRKASRVSFPTAFASDLLGSGLQVPVEKRAVVFHGTDREFWRASAPSELPVRLGLQSGRYVLFVSKFYPQKRVDVLVDGYAKWRRAMSSSNEDWRLVLVGDYGSPEREAAFKEHTTRLGISDQVLNVTGISRSDLRALYHQAAVFVLPSELETFGQPFVEALASGAPVIAADTGFARELCGDAAVFFPHGDANGLAAAMGEIVSNAPLRASMILRGHDRADQFSWTREARETLNLLEQVAQ